MGFLPDIMNRASRETDKSEQFKYCIALLTATKNSQIPLKQPLYPTLGETFNGFIEDVNVSFEQISIDPPVSAFNYHGNGFHCYGQLQVIPSVTPKGVYLTLVGHTKIAFKKSKELVVITEPYIKVNGLLTGTRTFKVKGDAYVYSPTSCLFAKLTFSPGRKGLRGWFGKPPDRDFVVGEAFRVHPDTIGDFEKSGKAGQRPDPGIVDGKKLAQSVFKIEGKWTEVMNIGDL